MRHLAVLLAPLFLLQDAKPWSVHLTARDGSVVRGTMDLPPFEMDSALGKIKVEAANLYSVVFQPDGKATVLLKDGNQVVGTPSLKEWKVKSSLGEMTLKGVDLKGLTILGPAGDPAPGTPGPPGAKPPPGPAPPGLKPAKSLGLKSVLGRLLFSKDGKQIYLLDATDSKVLLVDSECLAVSKEIPLEGGEKVMALTPDGRTIVCAGNKQITVVSVEPAKVIKSFAIEQDILEVCPLDGERCYAIVDGRLALVSISKQAIVERCPQGAQGSMHLLGDRIVTGAGSIYPPDKSKGRDAVQWPAPGPSNYPGSFTISPDGKFAAWPTGVVTRLARSAVADMALLARVDPHLSSAWTPDGKKLLLFTGAGFVKEVDVETLELSKSWQLGYQAFEARVDASGSRLYILGAPVGPGSGSGPRERPVCDLLVFDLPK